MWIVYSILAVLLFTGIEMLYRIKFFVTFKDALPFITVPILFGNFLLFRILESSSSWLLAWGVLTLGSACARVLIALYLGEIVNMRVLGGVSLVLCGVLVINNR